MNFLNYNIIKHLKQQSNILKVKKEQNIKFQHMLMHNHIKILKRNSKKNLQQNSNILKL